MMQPFIEYFISSPEEDVITALTQYFKEVFCNVNASERHKLKENGLWDEMYKILTSPDSDSYKLTLEMLRSSDLYQHKDLMGIMVNDENLSHVFNSILINEHEL